MQIRAAFTDGRSTAAALRSYFGWWNGVDFFGALLTLASLALMAAATRTDAIDPALIACFQAVAGLLCGVKTLYFLRGLDFSAFLISMLEAILLDMANFFVVLFVIMATCARRVQSTLTLLCSDGRMYPFPADLPSRSSNCSRTRRLVIRQRPTRPSNRCTSVPPRLKALIRTLTPMCPCCVCRQQCPSSQSSI